MMPRIARAVVIGSVTIGGNNPVAVQTMWKNPCPSPGTDEFSATLASLDKLSRSGCAIVRFSVPDMDSADRLGALALATKTPLVADIHFDWRIALRCLDFPVAKIRVNPGNIGAEWKVRELAEKAKSRGVPLRIGVNAGSLPKDLASRLDATRPRSAERTAATADALVEAAEREVETLDRFGFANVVVSMKGSELDPTIEANRRFSARHDIPLHLGVTEAGPVIQGVAKSAIAMHRLLSEGIGSTIRVSLSDSCESEVAAGREIVALSTGKRRGVTIVGCPRCGRAGFDTHAFLGRWSGRLAEIDTDIVVAVMGCEVNGPGEARHADIGIAGAGNRVVVFRGGKIVRTTSSDAADTVFEDELSAALDDARGK